jgi:hypothetical protein
MCPCGIPGEAIIGALVVWFLALLLLAAPAFIRR